MKYCLITLYLCKDIVNNNIINNTKKIIIIEYFILFSLKKFSLEI